MIYGVYHLIQLHVYGRNLRDLSIHLYMVRRPVHVRVYRIASSRDRDADTHAQKRGGLLHPPCYWLKGAAALKCIVTHVYHGGIMLVLSGRHRQFVQSYSLHTSGDGHEKEEFIQEQQDKNKSDTLCCSMADMKCWLLGGREKEKTTSESGQDIRKLLSEENYEFIYALRIKYISWC